MNLSTLILAALGIGILFGALLNTVFPLAVAPVDHYFLAPCGQAFLRLIQFVVVPIVFSSLILGLTRVQGAAQVGRYALKLVATYLPTSLVAVSLGLSTGLLLKPGAGFTGLPLPEAVGTEHSQSLIDWIVSLIPVNPLEALSTGNLLQTIISAALVGMGIQLVGEKAASFVSFIESVYEISERILFMILYVAPIGVFALIASVVATQGLALLSKLLFYVLGLVLAFTIMLGFYAGLLWLLRMKPRHFFQSFMPAFSIAFGTASSNAVLPVALQNAEESYGIREEVASFAIPLGTALKRDGSAIFQGFNALFIAQIYHVPLTPSLLLTIALTVLLVSYSTAGVPGSGIIAMTTVLTAVGLPVEGVAIVAGVDRLTDGFKTIINLVGNIANAAFLDRWESQEPEASASPQLTSEEA